MEREGEGRDDRRLGGGGDRQNLKFVGEEMSPEGRSKDGRPICLSNLIGTNYRKRSNSVSRKIRFQIFFFFFFVRLFSEDSKRDNLSLL